MHGGVHASIVLYLLVDDGSALVPFLFLSLAEARGELISFNETVIPHNFFVNELRRASSGRLVRGGLA